MYGIPANLDLAALVGDRLDSITIQEYQVEFQFDQGMSFVVEGHMDVSLEGSPVAQWEQETAGRLLVSKNVLVQQLNHLL